MAIEFDIEDIIGAGCLASLGRGLATLSCLWLGAATGSFSFLLAEGAVVLLEGGTPDPGDLVSAVVAMLAWGPLLMFLGDLIPLFFPLVLLVYFKFARGDGGSLRAWVLYAATTGLLVLLSLRPWKELGLPGTALAGVGWVGFVGSLGILAAALAIWQRRRLEEHLRGVAEAAEQRRRVVAGAYGTAVADREFATGEGMNWSPPPVPKHPHPQVPSPRPENPDG